MTKHLLIPPIRLYQLWSDGRDRCGCNHADGRSCSQRTLDAVRAGATTSVVAVLLAASSCDTSGGGSGGNQPCIPYNQDPNNPDVCTSGPDGPPPPPAQSDSKITRHSNGEWRVL